MSHPRDLPEAAVAVLASAGRFPKAGSVAELWRNLRDGVEGVTFLSFDEARDAGADPALVAEPRYVRAAAHVEDPELFDAAFFGYNPREAEAMDPQQRLFLECAWEALETAGYDPERFPGAVGVFGGSAFCTYLLRNLYTNPKRLAELGDLQVAVGNERDALASTVSYKLGLRGPAVAVQTFCSTSLVSVHLACQSLLAFECDLALAGGVAIGFPQKAGYLFQEGGILSPDGRCRTFDARAQGSIMGNGVALVALKRLEEAVEDGDTIQAVILGSAVNNDGSLRAGYAAPGLEGQSAVITEALAAAGVEPEGVSLYEAHGTATPLGDSIELGALLKAFRGRTERRRFCAIGSVKPNVGHLDRAAGVTGLIKAVESLRHREIPPSLNFERTSPDIDLDESPFYVVTERTPWKVPPGVPRRAGVSSFGLGGTNAHVVLEEAPEPAPSAPGRPAELLVLSARTGDALEAAARRLADHLEEAGPHLGEAGPGAPPLADVAYTLAMGRKVFSHRRAVVAADAAAAVRELRAGDPHRHRTAHQESRDRPVAFLLPGVGDHHPGMGRDLYRGEATFRDELDRLSALFAPHLGLRLVDVLYPAGEDRGGETSGTDLRRLLGRGSGEEPLTGPLARTAVAQPAVFAVEVALARTWMEWGIVPDALLGYSLGELTAAHLAGVLSLEDAAEVVARRAALIDALPPGAMLAVSLGEAEAAGRLDGALAVAGVNAPDLTVVAGPEAEVEALARRLEAEGVAARRLAAGHAFHTPALEEVADAVAELLAGVTLRPPEIPLLSNLTGDWLRPQEAVDPAYWALQMCRPVRFADALGVLWKGRDRALLEVGPGRTLSSMARQLPAPEGGAPGVAVASLAHPAEGRSDLEASLDALGRLWLAGARVDWQGYFGDRRRRRVPLPTYPFERRRYWVEPGDGAAVLGAGRPEGKRPDPAEWFYKPAWRPSLPPPLPAAGALDGESWLVYGGEAGPARELAKALAAALTAAGAAVTTADPARPAPADGGAWEQLLREMETPPRRIMHLASLGGADAPFETHLEHGFESLTALARALSRRSGDEPVELWVVTDGLFSVTGAETLIPAKATLLGPLRTLPQEQLDITTRLLELEVGAGGEPGEVALRLLREVAAEGRERELAVAWRGRERRVQEWVPVALPPVPPPPAAAVSKEQGGAHPRLRSGGAYLITGGLGGVGRVLAAHLARRYGARLVLTGRSGLPPREEWDHLAATLPAGDPRKERIAAVLELEDLGAAVRVVAADASDENAMRRAVAEAEAAFGRLDGVIHAAGSTDERGYRGAAETDAVARDLHFLPKVEGARVLARVLEGRELDFCLLMSSLSTVLGGLGLTAYSAANAFLDAFAEERGRKGGDAPWIAVDWDSWGLDPAQHEVVGATVAPFEMSPEEGCEAFERILAHDVGSRLVESTGDLEARIDCWVRLTELRAAAVADAGEVHARPELDTAFAPPRDDREAVLCAAWEAVLGLERVGVDDDFFELGGHSLLATQLFSRLRRSFDVELSLRDLFEAPTVASLAERIASAAGTAAAAEEVVPVPRREEMPASSQQVRLWLLDQLAPGSSAYNRPGALRLEGRLDVESLGRALSEVVRRHEALRTVLRLSGDEPVQVVRPHAGLRLPMVDLAGLDPEERPSRARLLAGIEAARPFDLAAGPLLRAALLRLAPEEHVLLFTMHHVVSDGWSEGVLVGETVELYAAFGEGRPSPLPPLPVGYPDYAAWQRRWLAGPEAAADLSYWRRRLADAPTELELAPSRPGTGRPGAEPSGTGASLAGGRLSATLEPELGEALGRLAREAGVTLFTVLLGAFGLVLRHHGGRDDLLVGTPVAGRSTPETERLIGFFANTLVLRLDLGGDPTFRELLARLGETALDAQEHAALPFEQVVSALRPDRHLDRSPLFQVWFVLQSTVFAPPEIPGLTFEALDIRAPEARHDLLLDATEGPEGLRLLFEYKADLLPAAKVEVMARQMRSLLGAAVGDPEQRLSVLAALLGAEAGAAGRERRQEYAAAVATRLREPRRRRRVVAAPDESTFQEPEA